MHAPKPIPSVPRRDEQLLPSPQQPATRVSREPSTVPPHPSESGAWPSHPSTPAPPRSNNTGQNVIVITESSSGRGHTPEDQTMGGCPRVNQPLPRQSMGSDVIVVPLSSASTPSSTPARGMSRLAQHPSVTSLTGSGILRRTPSGRPQRSQTPFVVNPPSPVLTGPVVSTPRLSSVVRLAAPQPIVMQQSPQAQPVQRLPSPFPAAVTSTSGSDQHYRAGFPILHRTPGPMADTSFGPVPVPIASSASPVLMPRARGPQMTPHPHPLPSIRQHSPVSRLRRAQTPIEATQHSYTRTSPTRLSRRHRPEVILMPARTESTRHHRPQHTRVDPVTVILPSRPIGRAQQHPLPGPIVMPARTESMRNRRQLRPIDTSVALPAAVTAITYPETVSRVRTTTQPAFVVPQPSPESSHADFRAALQGAERPIFIRRSPSSRRVPYIPIEAAQPSRLTRRHRPQPTVADRRIPPPPRQSKVVLMPESERSRQNRRRLHPIDTSVALTRPVTAMTYPETVGRGRTTRPATPFITPLPSPTSSSSSPRPFKRVAERPAVIRKSPSRSPNPRRAQPSTTTPTQAAQPSRLTKRRRPQPTAEDPQPEIVVMPARTESMRSRQTHHQPHPIEVPQTRAVTTITYPETVSQVRTTGQPPPRPISSNSSFRSSTPGVEHPVVIRSSPSRSSFRRAPQPPRAVPVPVTPSSQASFEPQIVVMPARRHRRDQSRSTDTSPIPLWTPLDAHWSQIPVTNGGSGVITESRSDPSVPRTAVVPIDSEAEETTAFRPPMSRRASFSGRDMISYGSRASPTTRSYSSDDDNDDSPPVCVTPSHRGRSRSPHMPMTVTPTSRQSQSPRRIYHPSSTDLWDQKSRTHSQRGWYRRRSSTESSPASISANTLLRRPAGRGSNYPVVPGHITDTVSIRRKTTFKSRGGSRRYDRSAGEVVVRQMRGDLEDRTGIMLGPEPRLKRTKSTWSKILSNL